MSVTQQQLSKFTGCSSVNEAIKKIQSSEFITDKQIDKLMRFAASGPQQLKEMR